MQHNCDFAAIDPLLQVPLLTAATPHPHPNPQSLTPLLTLRQLLPGCCWKLTEPMAPVQRVPAALPPSLACLPILSSPQEVDEEGAEKALYVSAVEQPLRSTPHPPLGSKAEKCDRFVEQAMEEMGSINICECCPLLFCVDSGVLRAAAVQERPVKGGRAGLRHVFCG